MELTQELTPARARLLELIERHNRNMAEISSQVLNMNASYIQQYISKRTPRKLDEDIRIKLGNYFDVDPDLFKEDYKPLSKINHVGMITIDELDTQVSAGDGIDAETSQVIARWTLRKGSIRGTANVASSDLKIIQVVGDSMYPTFVSGQKVIVDISHRVPTHPGIYVVWDGLGLLIKRVEHIAHSSPPRFKIYSDNQIYSAREANLEEVNIQGRVIGAWVEF